MAWSASQSLLNYFGSQNSRAATLSRRCWTAWTTSLPNRSTEISELAFWRSREKTMQEGKGAQRANMILAALFFA